MARIKTASHKTAPCPSRRARDWQSSDDDEKYYPMGDISGYYSSDADVDGADDLSIWEDAEEEKILRKRRCSGRRKGRLQWQVWEKEYDEQARQWEQKLIAGHDLEAEEDDQGALEIAEASPDLLVPLLRYQKEWLAWGLKQESECGGGILADEMGMGKTIQAIALVLKKRQGPSEDAPCSSSAAAAFPRVKCTLVVCPVAALTQWDKEIARCTLQGSMKVLVYHGAKKKKFCGDFSSYDFVLTTYATVTAEHKKSESSLSKFKCRRCSKRFDAEKLPYHELYHFYRREMRLDELRDETRRILNPDWSPSKSRRKNGGREGKKAEGSHDPCQSSKEPLYSVKWERIIIDEAHVIKDKQSRTAKAVYALESLYRWALTGTPLQNCLGELYSLVRFLQVPPYSYYFCRSCDCKMLTHVSSIQCPCSHDSHFCWFNKYIDTPIRERYFDEGIQAIVLLKHKLLKRIMLRRTKEGRAADLALPVKIVKVRRDYLDAREEDFYKTLYKECQLEFNTYVEAGNLMNNYANIFDLITRLRQALDHPYLVIYSKSAKQKNFFVNCGICGMAAEDHIVASCAHIFCRKCLIFYCDELREDECPTCYRQLTDDLRMLRSKTSTTDAFKSSNILDRIHLERFQTSTKIEALLEEITFMFERDGSAKAIVYSQFTDFLDLISHFLQEVDMDSVKFVGSMTVAAREAAVKRFNEDRDCRIFLMSLRAGGVALNLTAASNVFLMDPWWNSAVEQQACDRVYRIGQKNPVSIVKFTIKNSIEEKILQLQEGKQKMLEGALSGSPEALGGLSADDLRQMFL